MDVKKAVILYLLFLTGALNIFLFIAIASQNGGDAVSGAHIGSQYFVSSHGVRTEVTAAFYTYSLIHVCSVLLTTPVAMAAGAFLVPMFIKMANGAGGFR
jgi:hypothetical protein